MKTQPERTGRCRALALLLGVAVTASLAEAQTAGSFDELQEMLNPGDGVTVTDHTGRDLTGRLINLSPSSLALEVAGARRELIVADVALVHQWRSDSRRNGALIGLAAGAFPAILFTAVVHTRAKNEGGSPTSAGVTAAALSFGAAAGIGAGVDALIDTPYVVYGQTKRTRRRVTVSPLMSRDSRGVAFSLGF